MSSETVPAQKAVVELKRKLLVVRDAIAGMKKNKTVHSSPGVFKRLLSREVELQKKIAELQA